MLKRVLFLSLSILIPAMAFAAPNVGGCGLGSKLMDGNEGLAPQILAVTTNGTFGNQTFGISSGTLGCSQNGVVKSNWKTAMFIGSNVNMLARDMSVGKGESIDALSSLLGMTERDKDLFAHHGQEDFDEIFPSTSTSAAEVRVSLKRLLEADAQLAVYADRI